MITRKQTAGQSSTSGDSIALRLDPTLSLFHNNDDDDDDDDDKTTIIIVTRTKIVGQACRAGCSLWAPLVCVGGCVRARARARQGHGPVLRRVDVAAPRGRLPRPKSLST